MTYSCKPLISLESRAMEAKARISSVVEGCPGLAFSMLKRAFTQCTNLIKGRVT
jgi:hypothetical protein